MDLVRLQPEVVQSAAHGTQVSGAPPLSSILSLDIHRRLAGGDEKCGKLSTDSQF